MFQLFPIYIFISNYRSIAEMRTPNILPAQQLDIQFGEELQYPLELLH